MYNKKTVSFISERKTQYLFQKFMHIKRALGMYISHSKLLKGPATDINLAIFQWDKRQQHKSFGTLNPSLKFYVIRSSGTDEGLLSLYLGRIQQIHSLRQAGFVPVIDWENYKTQYNVDFPVNGTRNAWEYYFEQPSSYTLEEVYKSMDVTLSGWRFFQHYQSHKEDSQVITYDMMQAAPVKKYIADIAREKANADGISEMIGVLVRGTDYTKLRPAGHPIAPTPEMVSEKIDEFLAEYGARRIFLATEDYDIYSFFTQKYGDLIYTTDKNLITNYSGHDYIANSIGAKNKYQFGLDYLVKMLCLSECRFFISSGTSGAKFARVMNNGRYEREYLFNLGVY